MKKFQNKTKIIKVSKVIRHILFAGMVLWAIGIPMVLLQIIFQKPVVTGWARLGLQGSFVLIMVFTLLANLQLFRFFDRLQSGALFDAQTVSHLAAAGKWLVVLWLFEVLHQILQSPSGSIGDSGSLLAGLILIFFAWLLREAQDLQAEQELTV